MKSIDFKGVKLLISVIIIYIILAFFDPKNILSSVFKSIDILLQIWPVFIFIILLTAFINYFLKPKQILKYFGEESGKRGVFYALLTGIISHGPLYAWYGLLEELRTKGVKDELLIIFFYSRAIKIPMIPFSIAVFGTPFTIIISLYILLFAYLQGKVFSHLYHK